MKEIINLTIITPVHNEGKTIFNTITEFFEYYKNSHIKIKFIISEDGSTDNSVEEIKRLQKIYDVYLISEKERKGYAQAVVDAFTLLDTNVACFIDSDGQCDPADLIKLLDKFDGENIVVGNRKPRRDSLSRLIISKLFGLLYRFLTKNSLKDPSCPYFITSKENIDKIISTEKIGLLTHGFWWEFYARAQYLGLKFDEIKINHRQRAYGNSVIFKFSTIPGIAIKNLASLFELNRILKR